MEALPDRKRRRSEAGTTAARQGMAAQPTVQTPDGRVCAACGEKAASEDPVDKALGLVAESGVVAPRAWAFPPNKGGKLQCRLCWYCLRVFNGKYAHTVQDPAVPGSPFHTSST